MSRRSWILFGLLAAFWGASYMFIKVALEDGVPAAWIVCIRTALAALVLWPIAVRLGALAGLVEHRWQIVLLAAVQVTVPFLLITVGEHEISSSLAGILVATAPIFTFLLAFALEGEERANAISLAGVAIGIGGVALLLGVDTGGSGAALVGGLLVVLASFGYALGAWYLKRNIHGVEPVGVVTGTMAASALLTAPALLIELPSGTPGLDAVGSLVTLGVVGTGISFVIFYSLIASEGPAKASLVAYIAPGFAVVYGVVLLDESFTAGTAVGLVLTVGGSWLAAQGRFPWQSPTGGELPAGSGDVAPASEPHGGTDPVRLERVLEGSDRLAS